MITKEMTSAGGLVFRKEKGKTEVVICKKSGEENVWCLPKGLVEGDEDLGETALREVEEETGLKGDINDIISDIDYWYVSKKEDIRVHKRVYYYLIDFVSGDTIDHDWEMEEVAWVPIGEAEKKLTYDKEKDIMKKADKLVIRNE